MRTPAPTTREIRGPQRRLPAGSIDTVLHGPETWDDTIAAAGKLSVDVTDWVNRKVDELMRWFGMDPADADLRGRWQRGVTSAAPRQHPHYGRAARGTKQWDRKRTARLRRELIDADLRRLDREALDA